MTLIGKYHRNGKSIVEVKVADFTPCQHQSITITQKF